MCTIANEYINSRHATVINEWLHLLNSQPILYNGTNHRIKVSIDTWLAAQNALPATQTRTVFVQDPLPHFNLHNASTS
jgi:hypothetical protein